MNFFSLLKSLIFGKNYDQILKGFIRVTRDLRDLSDREGAKADYCAKMVEEYLDQQNTANIESIRAMKTAEKLEALYDVEDDQD
jgi:hypothetical protein